MRPRFFVAALLLTAGACGGPTAPPPPPPPPPTTLPRAATLADLAATATSPEADTAFGCKEDVHGRVTITNAAPSSVMVMGVHRHATIESGRCNESEDFDYGTAPRFVTPNSSLVVMDGRLYTGGSGCCPDPDRCGGGTCGIRETFVVRTELGDVAAGSFAYRVTFQNCNACTNGTAFCPPARLAEP